MRFFIVLSLLISSLGAFAQTVEFKANAPRVVEIGEQFRLSYTLNEEGKDLQVPTFDGFDLLMGPSTSTSSSVSIINGNMTQSKSYTYTYILEGVKKGVHNIPSATVTVKGKNYRSNDLTIEVVESGGGRQANANRQENVNSAQAAQPTALNNESIFVEVEVSRRSLYIGESLVATLKVYTKVDLVNFGQSKFPDFSSFMAEEVPTPQRIELSRQNHNGSVYNVGVIRKMLLFPQHTGEITIEPFELECIVRQQLSRSRSFFDDFFGNYQDVKIKRTSKPIKITVKELPYQGRPSAYGGAVGKLTMRTFVSADTLKANEAITYRITLNGSGNLKLLEAPSIHFPPDFETYDPKVTKNINTDESGMHGSVVFEYLVIPRYSGDYKIPALHYSFFDPQTQSYKTLYSNEYPIHVLKGEGSEAVGGGTPAVQSFKKEDVRMLGEDIRYIKTGNLNLTIQGRSFYKTPAYWLSFVVPFFIFVMGAIIYRQRIKANSDLIKVKNRAANKMALKRMRAAATALKQKNPEAFYDEVLKALWGYMSYKLNIDKSELNRDNISDVLERKAVDKELIDSFIAILDECEFARYAPGGSSEQKMDELYKSGIKVITKLDKVIR